MQKETNIILESERLVVRQMVEADVMALASIWADERVTRFMGGPREFEKIREVFRNALTEPPEPLDLWPVVERDSGAVVGHCGLQPKEVDGRDEVELVYVIAANFWGKGYATEVAAALRDLGFRKLGLVRIVALIDPANVASERVALKLRMKHEADTVRPSGKTLRVFAIENLRKSTAK